MGEPARNLEHVESRPVLKEVNSVDVDHPVTEGAWDNKTFKALVGFVAAIGLLMVAGLIYKFAAGDSGMAKDAVLKPPVNVEHPVWKKDFNPK